MKKKIIIFIIVCLIILIGAIGFVFWNNRVVSTITLDINPSIEIVLNKEGKVAKVIALNNDSKDIISKDLKRKSLDDALDIIANNIIEKGYVDEDHIEIIIYSNGNVNSNDVEFKIKDSFSKRQVGVQAIVISNVTKEDEKLAKEYNVSPAKIAYVKSIIQDNENITIDNLADRTIRELDETKSTGFYCDKDYDLEGSVCIKEIKRFKAKYDIMCPNGYSEYEGKCYEDTMVIDKDEWRCNEPLKYDGEKCTYTEVIDVKPQYECEIGELHKKGDLFLIGGIKNAEKYYCVDKSTGKKPTMRCLNNKNHIMINGKCYNGPAPVINGGCPNGDVKRNGGCYSLDNEDQWECPDGNIYMRSRETVPELCPDTFTYRAPKIVGYSCPDGYNQDNKKCTLTRNEEAFREKDCPSGYTLVEDRMCLNKNKTTKKISGYYCEEERAALVDTECIIYDEKEAYHN